MLKRLFDIVFSLTFLIIFSPFLIAISILVFLFHGWPIMFVQKRPGKDNKTFNMIKFRSMKNLFDKNGTLLPDEERLTSFGKFIRNYSIDEFPEFLNVLKGDMSVVGPRPLLIDYLELYSEEQKRRHNVRPGVTGYAQVNGRNNLSWSEKFKLDLYYVEHQNFVLDLKIIFMTFFKVLSTEGVSSKNSVTSDRFTGNNDE